MKSFILTTLTFLAIAGTSYAGGGVSLSQTIVRQRSFGPNCAPTDVEVFQARLNVPPPRQVGFSGGAFVERTEVRRGLFGRVRSRSTFRAFVP